jgi:hypothetical protein
MPSQKLEKKHNTINSYNVISSEEMIFWAN